jgi:hypothetical protein
MDSLSREGSFDPCGLFIGYGILEGYRIRNLLTLSFL